MYNKELAAMMMVGSWLVRMVGSLQQSVKRAEVPTKAMAGTSSPSVIGYYQFPGN